MKESTQYALAYGFYIVCIAAATFALIRIFIEA